MYSVMCSSRKYQLIPTTHCSGNSLTTVSTAKESVVLVRTEAPNRDFKLFFYERSHYVNFTKPLALTHCALFV